MTFIPAASISHTKAGSCAASVGIVTMIRVAQAPGNRPQQRRRPGCEQLTAAGEPHRWRARSRRRRTIGHDVKGIQHSVDAPLDVTLGAAQRRQSQRNQRILKLTQVVASQRQVLQQVPRAGVPIRVAPLYPWMPAGSDREQLLADRRELLHQRRPLVIPDGLLASLLEHRALRHHLAPVRSRSDTIRS